MQICSEDYLARLDALYETRPGLEAAHAHAAVSGVMLDEIHFMLRELRQAVAHPPQIVDIAKLSTEADFSQNNGTVSWGAEVYDRAVENAARWVVSADHSSSEGPAAINALKIALAGKELKEPPAEAYKTEYRDVTLGDLAVAEANWTSADDAATDRAIDEAMAADERQRPCPECGILVRPNCPNADCDGWPAP